MANELIGKQEIDTVFETVSVLIKQAKLRVAARINSEMVMLYWSIGKTISEVLLHGEKPDYGRGAIEDISARLTLEFGRGFDKTTVHRMVQLYQEIPEEEKVATLSQQLSWSHFVELLPIQDDLKREFYATLCANEGWSVRALRERKNSMLYERTAISKKPEETIKNDLLAVRKKGEMSVDVAFRDPYVLSFLGLEDTYSEKDLENAILAEMQKFILEMGSDFAFLARQKHFVLDGDDYYIDLLFYHRGLNRLVVIDLKIGKFKPADKGQIELYLRYLEKNEMRPGENKPIALILCADKSEEAVKLMGLDEGDIRVAQYLTKMPPKEEFEKRLALAIANAKKSLDGK
ncbi:MAG: DUF1016 family protein [Bacilli bacterium]|nr:DUF1016 family protein [Bacilli bacterium]